jgi:hypothetical protein
VKIDMAVPTKPSIRTSIRALMTATAVIALLCWVYRTFSLDTFVGCVATLFAIGVQLGFGLVRVYDMEDDALR